MPTQYESQLIQYTTQVNNITNIKRGVFNLSIQSLTADAGFKNGSILVSGTEIMQLDLD